MNPQLAYILGEDPLDAALDGIEHRRFGNTAVLVGDAATRLAELPDGIIQCAVTSPPYFGLRSYSEDPAEIGKEQTPDEYVGNLLQVFSEVHRVLSADGTCWVNLGDSYCGYKGDKYGDSKGNLTARTPVANGKRIDIATPQTSGLKNKDLIGIPWKVAFALRDTLGFYLRQDIIWHKPNPMPESVRDRCTKAHEYVFLMSKSARYFFDTEAMKEPAKRAGDMPGGKGHYIQHSAGGHNKDGLRACGEKPVAETRNRRSVWTLSPKPYKEAHFAVYPPDLIEPMVLAGSKPGDIILDPFGGSGTTAGVAEKHGRYAILCELNPEYVELMPKRIESIQ